MSFGTESFGQQIFAISVISEPFVFQYWNEVCPKISKWTNINKVVSQWDTIEKNEGEWTKIDATESNIERCSDVS
jgi:hypothetical protein